MEFYRSCCALALFPVMLSLLGITCYFQGSENKEPALALQLIRKMYIGLPATPKLLSLRGDCEFLHFLCPYGLFLVVSVPTCSPWRLGKVTCQLRALHALSRSENSFACGMLLALVLWLCPLLIMASMAISLLNRSFFLLFQWLQKNPAPVHSMVLKVIKKVVPGWSLCSALDLNPWWTFLVIITLQRREITPQMLLASGKKQLQRQTACLW